MSSVRVQLNIKGVRAVLASKGVHRDLEKRVNAIADEANSRALGLAVRDHQYMDAKYYPDADSHSRSHGMVAAHVWSNVQGTLRQEEDDTLVSALDAGARW